MRMFAWTARVIGEYGMASGVVKSDKKETAEALVKALMKSKGFTPRWVRVVIDEIHEVKDHEAIMIASYFE